MSVYVAGKKLELVLKVLLERERCFDHVYVTITRDDPKVKVSKVYGK